MLGTTLGPYRIVELCGTGGMGHVYRARDDRLERDVAIKLLPRDRLADEDSRKLLHREARLLSRLNHSRIAGIHDVGREGGQDYLVLEYVPGGTLTDRLASGPLSFGETLRIGIGIAEGLASAHGEGVAHRDLKPGNIGFDARGEVKILDFGIGRLLAGGASASTFTRSTVGLAGAGTIPYMAPEQLRAETTDARTDLYALGVLLHEMISGRRPFGGDTEASTIESILHSAPPSLRTLDPSIPASFDAVVRRLLSRKPGERHGSAGELLADLRTIEADPTSRPAQQRRRRRRILAVVAAGILVALALYPARHALLRPLNLGGGLDRQSVVVFPLAVLGGEPGAEYLGRAFSEAITVNLSQGKRLDVMPVPSGAEAAHADLKGIVRAARRLGADRVISGSLVREERIIRATIQLLDAGENRVEWGGQYEIDASDVGRSTNDVALELASRLGQDAPSMHEYFRYEGGTPEMALWPGLPATIAALRNHDVERGLALTDSLLARYPMTPEAHVMRLVALVDQGNQQQGTVGTRQALIAGVEALEQIDPDNPNVPIHRSSLWRANYPTGREGEAERLLSRVLMRNDLRPGLRSHALRYRAAGRQRLGRMREATQDLELALRLDPANPYNYHFLSLMHAQQGHYDAALQRAREASAIDPIAFGGLYLASTMLLAGELNEALQVIEEQCEKDPSANTWSFRAEVLAELGRHEEAKQAIATAQTHTGDGGTEWRLARASGFLGEEREALRRLDHAIRLGFRSTILHEDSAFVRLWKDPRFLVRVARAQPESSSIPQR